MEAFWILPMNHVCADMGTTQKKNDSIQLNLRKFWFDSTHESQWLYKTWFEPTHDSIWISEIWFKSIHDSKNLPEFWFKSTYDNNKLFRILIRINSWLNDAIHFQFRLSFFWGFIFTADSVDLFGLYTQVLTYYDLFLELLTQVPSQQIDLNQLMAPAVCHILELIQPMTQGTFQKLSQNQLMTLVDSQVRID